MNTFQLIADNFLSGLLTQLSILQNENANSGLWLRLSDQESMFLVSYLRSLDQILCQLVDNGLAQSVFKAIKLLIVKIKPHMLENKDDLVLLSAKYFK